MKLALGYGDGNATDNNGNITSQGINIGGTAFVASQSYGYDKLNRLETVTEGTNWKQKFGYDRWGNRWMVQTDTSSFLIQSGITPLDGSAMWYRAGTNQLNVPVDNAGNTSPLPGRTYKYDVENRLVSVAAVPAQSGLAESMSYDGEGRRVVREIGGVKTIFVYDAFGQLAQEYGGVASGAAGRSYLFTDHLGSTRMRVGADGEVKGWWDYAPFGEELAGTAGARGGVAGYAYGGVAPSMMFTGQVRDRLGDGSGTATGLDYFGARYLSAAQGRFASPDPSRQSAIRTDPQSWNRYVYVLNSPHSYVDKNGLWPTPVHKAMIESIFGGALRSWQVNVLKDVSWDQDDPRGPGQRPENSNWHGMCTPSQDRMMCASGISDHINTNLADANRLGNANGLSEGALSYFGIAAHSLSDLGSPYHLADDGTPFTWSGTLGQGGLSHVFGEAVFGSYGTYGWLRIGAAIRNIIGGFFTAFPQEAGRLLGSPDRAAQRAIERYVNDALMPLTFRGGLTPGQADAARQCALGNPAACGIGPQP